MGDSGYLYSKGIEGNQHVINYLTNYLDPKLNCSFSLSSPSINEFQDSQFRIWGDTYERDELGIPIGPIDRDINTISQFIAAKNFTENAKNEGKIPVVIVAHGTNESKDINNNQTGKTHDKFHNYLNQAKSILEGLGAKVIIATPVKGCPFAQRNYDPESTVKTMASNVRGWYSNVAQVFEAFDSYTCSDTSACPGPDECKTRCLINVSPHNSSGFPNRSCEDDYIHPNSDGYALVAKAIGDAVLGLNLCQAETPTNTPAPTPTDQPNDDNKDKLKKGDLNKDGVVNSIDWSIMKSHFFESSNLSDGDINEDGVINSLDWSIMKSHFWENT